MTGMSSSVWLRHCRSSVTPTHYNSHRTADVSRICSSEENSINHSLIGLIMLCFFCRPNIREAKERNKRLQKTDWLNTPNVYKREEIDEIGTDNPKKITKVWLAHPYHIVIMSLWVVVNDYMESRAAYFLMKCAAMSSTNLESTWFPAQYHAAVWR